VYAGIVRVFVINPGSTSTKLALADVREGRVEVLERVEKPSRPGETPLEDFESRRPLVLAQARTWAPFSAIAARGGLIGPVSAGVYLVDEVLAKTSLKSPYGYHPANLGAPLALEAAKAHQVPAYVVDPPTVSEMLPEARVSGVPGLERQSRVHALNLRYVARKVAKELGKPLESSVLIGAHLGGGSSVALFLHGRMADATDALLGEGPFSANRAGTVPLHGVLSLVQARGIEAARHLLAYRSGFLGLLGTDNLKTVEENLTDPKTRRVVEAYALQIAKNLAAFAVHARPDAFFLTGSAARFEYVVTRVRERIEWMAPLVVMPGEFEAEALASGAARVLTGLEEVRRYASGV